ncbi:hypothetical protein PG995_000137 [Apiospora arundinis]
MDGLFGEMPTVLNMGNSEPVVRDPEEDSFWDKGLNKKYKPATVENNHPSFVHPSQLIDEGGASVTLNNIMGTRYFICEGSSERMLKRSNNNRAEMRSGDGSHIGILPNVGSWTSFGSNACRLESYSRHLCGCFRTSTDVSFRDGAGGESQWLFEDAGTDNSGRQQYRLYTWSGVGFAPNGGIRRVGIDSGVLTSDSNGKDLKVVFRRNTSNY